MLIFAILVTTVSSSIAQNDTTIYVTPGMDTPIYICSIYYNQVIIYAMVGCDEFHWYIDGNTSYENPIIITDNNEHLITFYGCHYAIGFAIFFVEPHIPNETTTTLWKRQHESMTIQPIGTDTINWDYYEFLWSTGETTALIDVTEPGTYTCDIMDYCGTATRTFIVQDNVEIYRAGVELQSGLNRPTWRTTPEQAEYISEVKVERDGFVVGTVPYEQGYYLDNIGSENAARTYKLTGILQDGTECPIPSYQKGTPHVDYSPNASNPNKLNMAWTPPYIEEGAPVSIAYFQICSYNPYTGEVTVLDQIGPNNSIGSYDINLFNGGYAALGVLFNEGKEYEDVSFSNMSEEILSIGEQQNKNFKIYPNPSNGTFTVEGVSNLTIYNTLGQTVATSHNEDDTHTFSLSSGIYFIKSDEGTVQKVVVE